MIPEQQVKELHDRGMEAAELAFIARLMQPVVNAMREPVEGD
jgi:hypothetical protein